METKSKTWNPNWLNDGVAFFTLRDGLYADKTSPEIGELLAAAVRESTPLHRQVTDASNALHQVIGFPDGTVREIDKKVGGLSDPVVGKSSYLSSLDPMIKIAKAVSSYEGRPAAFVAPNGNTYVVLAKDQTFYPGMILKKEFQGTHPMTVDFSEVETPYKYAGHLGKTEMQSYLSAIADLKKQKASKEKSTGQQAGEKYDIQHESRAGMEYVIAYASNDKAIRLSPFPEAASYKFEVGEARGSGDALIDGAAMLEARRRDHPIIYDVNGTFYAMRQDGQVFALKRTDQPIAVPAPPLPPAPAAAALPGLPPQQLLAFPLAQQPAAAPFLGPPLPPFPAQLPAEVGQSTVKRKIVPPTMPTYQPPSRQKPSAPLPPPAKFQAAPVTGRSLPDLSEVNGILMLTPILDEKQPEDVRQALKFVRSQKDNRMLFTSNETNDEYLLRKDGTVFKFESEYLGDDEVVVADKETGWIDTDVIFAAFGTAKFTKKHVVCKAEKGVYYAVTPDKGIFHAARMKKSDYEKKKKEAAKVAGKKEVEPLLPPAKGPAPEKVEEEEEEEKEEGEETQVDISEESESEKEKREKVEKELKEKKAKRDARLTDPYHQLREAGLLTKNREETEAALRKGEKKREFTRAPTDQEMKIFEAMDHLVSTQPSHYGSGTLEYEIIKHVLNPGGWLSDVSIDAYAQLINVRATHYAAAERDKKRVPYVHVFSNFTVVPTGVASGVPSLAGPPLPEQGSVKIRNISEEELMADANHIARCDVAIFPMMDPLVRDHWFGVFVFAEAVSIYDSINETIIKSHATCANEALKVVKLYVDRATQDLRSHWKSLRESVSLSMYKTVKQKDATSCGVLLCAAMDQISFGSMPSAGPKDVEMLRQSIACELAAVALNRRLPPV